MLTVVINQTTQDDRSDRVLTHPCSLRSACFFSDEGSEGEDLDREVLRACPGQQTQTQKKPGELKSKCGEPDMYLILVAE